MKRVKITLTKSLIACIPRHWRTVVALGCGGSGQRRRTRPPRSWAWCAAWPTRAGRGDQPDGLPSLTAGRRHEEAQEIAGHGSSPATEGRAPTAARGRTRRRRGAARFGADAAVPPHRPAGLLEPRVPPRLHHGEPQSPRALFQGRRRQPGEPGGKGPGQGMGQVKILAKARRPRGCASTSTPSRRPRARRSPRPAARS
jgi:hypothetical protein